MNNVSKNIVASVVLVLIGINYALALGISTKNIPSRAYDPANREKVVICHFPPGNTANYQTISISVNALDKHVDHHSDTFAVDGICPNPWQVPGSYNQTTGKPDTLSSTKCGVTSDMVDSVIKRLPEGSDVSTKSPELITDDKGANIFLKADAKVKVAFVYDGAGYSNSLGYFSTANPSGLTRQNAADKIIFPNFSKPSEGSLSLGDTVDLGSFTSGSMIGFTIVSNGWNASIVDPTRNVTQIFRTVKALNPETSDANRAHTVLLSDAKSGILLLGIEDLNRETCSYNDYGYCTDDDFNDAVIGICVDPPSAISNIKDIPPLELPPPSPPAVGISGPANWTEINMSNTEKK
jgi:hypothetical protein